MSMSVTAIYKILNWMIYKIRCYLLLCTVTLILKLQGNSSLYSLRFVSPTKTSFYSSSLLYALCPGLHRPSGNYRLMIFRKSLLFTLLSKYLKDHRSFCTAVHTVMLNSLCKFFDKDGNKRDFLKIVNLYLFALELIIN